MFTPSSFFDYILSRDNLKVERFKWLRVWYSWSALVILCPTTVELDLIVTEMLAFPLKSSINKNDSDLMIAIP